MPLPFGDHGAHLYTVDGRTLRGEDVRLVAERYVPVVVDEFAMRRAWDVWRLGTDPSARRETHGRTTGVGADHDLTIDEDRPFSDDLVTAAGLLDTLSDI